MAKSNETGITKVAVTITLSTLILLSAVAITNVPLQQAYSLSRYIVGADNPNPANNETNRIVYQPLEKDPTKPVPIPTTTSNSSIVPVGCAMDTIESLQSFLSCLGAK